MAWTTVTFDRDGLYKEVWTEPVRTVAKRYDLSDVGLRKICKRLGVPLPPLGYWARIAAGQKPRVTPLPSKHAGDTRYVRQVRIDEEADERTRREQAMLAIESPVQWPVIEVKPTTENVHRVVQRTGSRMKHRPGSADLLGSHGDDVLDIWTTVGQKDRALRIVDAILSAALIAGAKIVPKSEQCAKVHLDVQGRIVQVGVDEEFDHVYRQPTAAELARQAKEPWYRPDVRTSTPSGRLKLALFEERGGNPYLTLRDGKARPLEQRLDQVIPNLWSAVAKRRVESELRDEQHARWRIEREQREQREAVRKAEFERLKKTEEFVQRWRRATDLREYAKALELAGRGLSGARTEQTIESELAWIRKAADWLDPTTVTQWREVDGEC